MTEFLNYDQTIALLTLLISPVYVMLGYILRTNVKMGCDITSLKTANNIYHENKKEIDKDD